MGAHQTCDVILATFLPAAVQCLVDTRASVGLMAFLVNGLDCIQKTAFFLGMVAPWSFKPGVVAATHNPEHATHGCNAELDPVVADELVSHRSSPEKIPIAFYDIALLLQPPVLSTQPDQLAVLFRGKRLGFAFLTRAKKFHPRIQDIIVDPQIAGRLRYSLLAGCGEKDGFFLTHLYTASAPLDTSRSLIIHRLVSVHKTGWRS